MQIQAQVRREESVASKSQTRLTSRSTWTWVSKQGTSASSMESRTRVWPDDVGARPAESAHTHLQTVTPRENVRLPTESLLVLLSCFLILSSGYDVCCQAVSHELCEFWRCVSYSDRPTHVTRPGRGISVQLSVRRPLGQHKLFSSSTIIMVRSHVRVILR